MLNLEQPEENVRTVTIGKNTLRLNRNDPYGFVTISYEHGSVPEMLKGQYTSFSEASRRVEQYLALLQLTAEKEAAATKAKAEEDERIYQEGKALKAKMIKDGKIKDDGSA